MKSGDVSYAIFGGTFDPPHLGHQAVAETCLSHLGLNEVIWVPNFRNPLRRKSFATATHRLQMCQIATEDLAGMAVSDIEVTRGTKSFMIDTIEELLMVKPGKIWLVVGTDALEGFMNWKEPERLSRLCRLAVVPRPGSSFDKSSANLPEEIIDQIDLLPMRENRATSSLIRDDINRGISPELMLNPKVWDYIQERGLYSE